MGICHGGVHGQEISEHLRNKAIAIFQKIDVSRTGKINRDTTLKFWQSNFAKLNTEALFKQVDFQSKGEITLQEWLAFWDIVKKNGHDEKEISQELDDLMEGKAWVNYQNVEKYIQKDKKRRQSQIQEIVRFETQQTLKRSKTHEYK
ncbi:hypothetical protein pb186bvf_018845 [Paramecium bursaria]